MSARAGLSGEPVTAHVGVTVVVVVLPGAPADGCLSSPGIWELIGKVSVIVVEAAGVSEPVTVPDGVTCLGVGRPGLGAARNAGVWQAATPLVAVTDTRFSARTGWLEALQAARASSAAVFSRVSGAVAAQRAFASPGGLFVRQALADVGQFDSRLASDSDSEVAERLAGSGYSVNVAPNALLDLLPGGAASGAWLDRDGRPAPPGHPVPVYSRVPEAGPGTVFLTIDDGPSPNTESLVRLLDEHGARASFFVVGEAARAAPAAIRQIAAGGHDIHSHSMTHRAFDVLSREEIVAELSVCADVLGWPGTGGPPLVRLPFGAGAGDAYVHDAVASWRSDCALVQWSVDSNDYKAWRRCVTPEETDRLAGAAASGILRLADLSGAIILMHDWAYGTRHAPAERFARTFLAALLRGIGVRGLTTAVLSEYLEASTSGPATAVPAGQAERAGG